jgi:hypothetical protein
MDQVYTYINDGMVTAVSYRAFCQLEIPAGGISYVELHGLMHHMNVQGTWLITELNAHPNAGPLVSYLASLSDPDVVTMFIKNSIDVQMVVAAPEEGVACAICLDCVGKSWSRTAGCVFPHRFHTHCLVQWEEKTCPVCRQ